MFSWNTRRYWDIFHYELQLHHFPGQPELQPNPQMERTYRRPLPLYLEPNEVTDMPPNDANDRANHVLIFRKRCYITAFVFTLISVLQWLIFALLIKHQNAFLLPGFICLILAICSLLLLTFFQFLSSKLWVGFIFAAIFVETVAWGTVLLLAVRSPLNILAAFAAAVVLEVLCHVLGAWLPKIVLPGEITVALFLILFVAAGIIVLTLLIVTDQAIYQSIYYGLVGILAVVMSLYYGQIVNGRRRSLQMKEFLSCALNVYIHFLIFFMVFYHIIWVQKW